jgi:hypothetical protein
LLSLQGVVSPSLLNHGGVGLARVGGHARAPAKPRESRIYDGGGVGYLSCARGSNIPCSDRGGIRRGVHGILRAGIWCAITSIPPLVAAVLRLGTVALDPLWDHVYGGLYDPVRGLYLD